MYFAIASSTNSAETPSMAADPIPPFSCTCSSHRIRRFLATYIGLIGGFVTALMSPQACALPLLSGEFFNPVLWGPAAVSSQFVQYSVEVSSSGSSADQQFLNVVRDDGIWVVQNLPVGFEPGMSAVATNIDSALFVNGSTYQTTLGATPVNAAPVFSAGVVQNLGPSVNRMFNDGFGVTDYGSFVSPGLPSNIALNFGPVLSFSYHRGMPDLDQDVNECVPTSAANSITWLNDTYDLGITMTTQEIADTLKDQDHMQTSPTTGTSLENFLRGKDKFAQENGLPIVTHLITLGGPRGPSIANILAEMKKGQDVELVIAYTPGDAHPQGGAHAVTLVGLLDLGPFGAGIWFNDPDDDGPIGETQTNWSWLDGDNGFSIRGLGADSVVAAAVAESVVLEPGSLALVLLGMLAVMGFHVPRATRVT